MNDEQLRQFLWHSVTTMETHGFDPYARQNAQIANSGISFGHMQSDVSSGNSISRSVFREIMATQVKEDGSNQKEIDEIVSKAEKKQSLTAEQLSVIDTALSENHDLIDKADQAHLDETVANVKSVLDAAARNPNGPGELNRDAPNPKLLTALGEWGNMTGGLGGTAKHMAETTNISYKDFDNYFKGTKFYREQATDNFKKNWPGRVDFATNHGLNQIGATYTAISSEKGQIELAHNQINVTGSNSLAVYNNAEGQRVGALLSFNTTTSPETAGNLNVNNSGTTLQPIQRGTWKTFNISDKGEATYTPTNNVATNGIYSNTFQQSSSYSLFNDPAIARIGAQLNSSGFSLQQQPTARQIDQNELMRQLQQQIQDSQGLAITGGANNNSQLRGVEQNNTQRGNAL